MKSEHDWEDFLKSFQSMTDQEKERAVAAMTADQRGQLEALLKADAKRASLPCEENSLARTPQGFGTLPAFPAPPSERYFAYLLEMFPLMVLVFVPVIGALLATAYILFRDALFDGQSVGKKLLRLRVVRLADHQPAGIRESAMRNFPLAIGAFLPVIPVIGHILGGTFSTLVFFIEAILISVDKNRRRMGDKFAGTIVIREVRISSHASR